MPLTTVAEVTRCCACKFSDRFNPTPSVKPLKVCVAGAGGLLAVLTGSLRECRSWPE
jgi:hypothetical protein